MSSYQFSFLQKICTPLMFPYFIHFISRRLHCVSKERFKVDLKVSNSQHGCFSRWLIFVTSFRSLLKIIFKPATILLSVAVAEGVKTPGSISTLFASSADVTSENNEAASYSPETKSVAIHIVVQTMAPNVKIIVFSIFSSILFFSVFFSFCRGSY